MIFDSVRESCATAEVEASKQMINVKNDALKVFGK